MTKAGLVDRMAKDAKVTKRAAEAALRERHGDGRGADDGETQPLRAPRAGGDDEPGRDERGRDQAEVARRAAPAERAAATQERPALVDDVHEQLAAPGPAEALAHALD